MDFYGFALNAEFHQPQLVDAFRSNLYTTVTEKIGFAAEVELQDASCYFVCFVRFVDRIYAA